MKKPAVPWTCGSVSRNSGLLRMGERGPVGAEVVDAQASSVDDVDRLLVASSVQTA